MTWHRAPYSDFLRVQEHFPVDVWILSRPYAVYLRINVAVQVEPCFIAKEEVIERVHNVVTQS